ncbi:MAG: hypothetical protein WC789_00930 [Lentisphaeria bacterium]|jgi:hypothetical protein
MKDKDFYPMLLSLMNTTIEWVAITADESNLDKTTRDLRDNNNFNLHGDNERNPFTPALLIAASYIYFLYPHESSKSERLSDDYFNDFEIIQGEKKNMAGRLRNSLSHGRFKFCADNIIEFSDENVNSKDKNKNQIVFRIGFIKFGKFIGQCLSKNM